MRDSADRTQEAEKAGSSLKLSMTQKWLSESTFCSWAMARCCCGILRLKLRAEQRQPLADLELEHFSELDRSSNVSLPFAPPPPPPLSNGGMQKCPSFRREGAMVPALIRSEQLSPRQEINLEGQPTSGLEIEIHLQVEKKKKKKP